MTIEEAETWTEKPLKINKLFWSEYSGTVTFPAYELFELEGVREQETNEPVLWPKELQKISQKYPPTSTQEDEEIIGVPVEYLQFESWVGKVSEQDILHFHLTNLRLWEEAFRVPLRVYSPLATDSSTLSQQHPSEIDQEIELLFDRACEEVFEDGMESEFSHGLTSSIRKYGNAAVAAWERLILTEQVNAEIASEALRWLGYINHSSTYQSRLHLLERSLHNSSARVRDGAALGLASLDDPHAIPYLRSAIEREGYQELRHDLEQVVVQLENTKRALAVENDSEI